MDFFSAVLFLFMYYIRPHEWIGSLNAFRPALVTMAIGVWAMLTREKGFTLAGVFKTPHDWLMGLYFIWIVGTSPAPIQTFKGVYSLFLFYVVIVHALSSTERIRKFMQWWAIMILIVAAMAVLSEYGIDPTHSYDITHGRMKDRLILNTYLFNNPNALGHSVVPALGMIYYIFFWNRFFTYKLWASCLSILPMYCVFLTMSKGAFLSGFATLLATLTFRRPWYVKVLILLGAATIGWAAVRSLPRMNELEHARGEGAIQGRLLVFTWGLDTLHRTTTGVGWGYFAEGVSRRYGFRKAPHSSYVAAGGELGWPGLALFVGILYACGRTLVVARTRDVEEERLRRVLFILLISYVVSSWLVGWLSRASFFIMVAAIAAFHRQMQGLNDLPLARVETLKPAGALVGPAVPVAGSNMEIVAPATIEPRQYGRQSAVDLGLKADAPITSGSFMPWKKLGSLDLLWIGVLTYGVVVFWKYILKNL